MKTRTIQQRVTPFTTRQVEQVAGKCDHCGASFWGKEGKKFCSRKCRNAANYAKSREA